MDLPSWAKLCGIVIVLLGLAMRLKPTLVVVVAALATGLSAGLPLLSAGRVLGGSHWGGVLTRDGREGVIDMLGRGFAENRLMTLFIITLPAIGICERFGLQRQAGNLIRRFKVATVGRLLFAYQCFRVLMGVLGIRMSGHPTFVRPLVYPMAHGAATAGRGNVSDESTDRLKAASAGAENYGNFYGQNLSPVQPGVLLVYGVLKGAGYAVSVWRLVLYAIPIATLTVGLGYVQFRVFGRRYAALPGGRDE
jgi:uncharacterized membrane protein